MQKLLDYLNGYLQGQNRSRVAILLAPFVTAGANWVSQKLGLDPNATLTVTIGVLAYFGIYIRNNGLQENSSKPQ